MQFSKLTPLIPRKSTVILKHKPNKQGSPGIGHVHNLLDRNHHPIEDFKKLNLLAEILARMVSATAS